MVSPGPRAVLDAMAEFRLADSATALVEQAPEAIGRLGFDRVLVSRVDDGIWVPGSMFVRHDPRWAQDIVEAGRGEPTLLDSVVESDVVDRGGIFVVDEVQTHPRVCRPIARVSRSDNYGVAPITIGPSVVGMVHVDCYFQQRRVHREECQTLAVLAETMAAHLSRLLVLEQLQQVRVAEWSSRQPEVGDAIRCPRRKDRTKAQPALTDRELDVIRLMAAGETNHRIARRLAITEGTVKTHVSHILHKLDAANRAQAVSLWARR